MALRSPTAAILILAVPLLAGCIAGDEGAPAAPDAVALGDLEAQAADAGQNVTRFAESLQALSAEGAKTSDWILMPMVAGPDRPLQGFTWAVNEYTGYPDPVAAGHTVLDMEVLVIAPPGEEDRIRQVIVGVFREVDGHLEPGPVFTRGVWHEVYRTPTGEERVDYEPPWPDGYFHNKFYEAYEDLRPGETLYLLVAVEATASTEVAAIIRFVRDGAEWDSLGETTMTGLESLRARARTPAPKLAAPAGNGTGFRFPQYVDNSYAYTDPGGAPYSGYEGWTDDVVVTEESPATDLRPLGGVRKVEVSYASPYDRGWGISFGLYLHSSAAATWEADFDVHGTTSNHAGPAAPWSPAFVGYLMAGVSGNEGVRDLARQYEDEYGLHSFVAVGEGPGGHDARLRVDSVSATGFVDVIALTGFDFGATLEDLFGVPGRSSYALRG